MPDPTHLPIAIQRIRRPLHAMSDQQIALLAAQRPRSRWRIAASPLLGYPLASALIIALTLLAVRSCAATVDSVLPALERVESNGDPRAVGDNGKAKGILQVWPGVVQDVNRIAGTRYTHDDAFDPEKARAMARVYLGHYCTAKRLGRAPTAEDYARVWNGGPNGYRRASTNGYWQKVKAAL